MTLENSGCNSPGAVWRGISMRAVTVFAAAMVAWQAGVMNAAAQAPTATLSTVVVSPGAASTVTVTGTPGHYFALVGSTTNAGFAYAGVPFALGTDIRILAMGNLDGTGQAVVNVVPPFVGSALDRYYIQAVTSTSPSYVPLQTAPGNVLVNGDLAGLAASGVAGPAGPAGPEGPAGPAGPAGAAGATGAQGPAGADGAPGAQGPAGADGATGPQGAAGVAGPQGPQGVHGADGATGAPGTTGPQGVQGPQGPQGVQGVPGSIANVVVRTAAAAATSVTVLCEPGEVTFGGGGSAASVANNQTIIASIPVSGATVGTAVPATNGGAANGWRVTANVSLSLTAYVICGT